MGSFAEVGTTTANIYLDESGTLNLVPNLERFYVIAAIKCAENLMAHVSDKLQSLKCREFNGGELKSSKVGNDESRRRRILLDLVQLPITVDVLVVDKLYAADKFPGLQYRNNFQMFVRRLILERITFPGVTVSVFMDNHGRSNFMDRTVRYLEKRLPDDLFEEITFVDSRDHILVQVADFFAGSFRRYLETESNDAIKIALPVLGRFIPIVQPQRLTSILPGEDTQGALITSISVGLVHKFIDEHRNSDDETERIMSFVCEKLLLQHISNPSKYTYGSNIRHEINRHFDEKISKNCLKRLIIPSLRDAGVIIASSNQGYKIPSSTADMNRYCEHVQTTVVPYLVRLKGAQDTFYSGSSGVINILEHDNVRIIRALVEALKNAEVESTSSWAQMQGS